MNADEIKQFLGAKDEGMSKESLDEAVNNLKQAIDSDILSAVSIMSKQPVPDNGRILWDGERFISQ